jgi:hypothetical protein
MTTDATLVNDAWQLLGEAGQSEYGAARALGIDHGTMREYCNGEKAMPPHTVRDLMQIAQRRRNSLVSAVLEAAKLPTSGGPVTDAQVAQVNRMLRKAELMVS